MEHKSKQSWATIGNKECFFRSNWEKKYAYYLQWLKAQGQIKEWHHEPKTFWFEGIRRGTNNYKPDFIVYNNDNSHHWCEVKGYFDPKSLTKLKRFRKYFPEEKIFVVDSKWFKENSKKLSFIPGFENKLRKKINFRRLNAISLSQLRSLQKKKSCPSQLKNLDV